MKNGATSANLSRLVEKGYLSGTWDPANPIPTQATIPWLWCPAASPDASAGMQNANQVSSYLYNPHLCYPGLTTGIGESRYTRIDKIPQNRALVMDTVCYPDSMFHMMASDGSTAGWNMAFPDGHAVFIESKELTQYVQLYGNKSGLNGAYQVVQAVDFLETIAENGNPFTTSITRGNQSYTLALYYGIRWFNDAGINHARTFFNNNEVQEQLP